MDRAISTPDNYFVSYGESDRDISEYFFDRVISLKSEVNSAPAKKHNKQ